MALNIKHLTERVLNALRKRLTRRNRGEGRLAGELRRIGERCANLPVLDARPSDEILDYDEQGIPRR